MEIELSDVSGLPDALKAVVQTVDGKSKLDLTKLMPAEDLTGLKTALQQERQAASGYAKFGKPDELAKRIADLEAQALKGGKIGEDAQAKLDAMDAANKAAIAAKDAKIAAMLSRNARAELEAELAKAGFIPEAIGDVAVTAMSRVTFDEDGNARLLDGNGKPMMGSAKDFGATFADLARELAAAKPYAVRDNGVGGGGKPPNSHGNGAGAKTVKRSDFDGMTEDAKRAHLKAGGKIVD